MVDQLVERQSVKTSRVERAFRRVPRHRFLPGVMVEDAYTPDIPIPTHFGADGVSLSSGSAPTIMAVMLERLECPAGAKVLEIGTGTGYNAALLDSLVDDGSVISIELDPEIAARARANLAAAGIRKARVELGDGWLGSPRDAPFDRIIVTAGVWDMSPHWVEQLSASGRLVAPLWLRPGVEFVVACVRAGSGMISRTVDYCGFVRLRGPHAGPERRVLVHDWIATLVAPSSEEIAILGDLLASDPRPDAAPPCPQNWHVRLAFDEPDSVQLTLRTDYRHQAFGLFDPVQCGLAVIDRGRLLAYGSISTELRLRAQLARMRPLSFADIQIDVIPSTEATTVPEPMLSRPDYCYAIRGLTDP